MSSIFLSPEYRQALTYSGPLPSTLESQAILDQLFNKIVLEGSTNEIKECLSQIASTSPGMELLTRLNRVLSSDKPLIIKSLDIEKNDNYSQKDNKVECTVNGRKIFRITLNPQEEIIVRELPRAVLVAHELFHALHDYENRSDFEGRCWCTQEVIPRMTNLEELLTIGGFASVTQDSTLPLKFVIENKMGQKGFLALTDKCCENGLLLAMGLPLSTYHAVIWVNGTPTPSFEDLLVLNSVGDIRELIEKNPSMVNEKLPGCDYYPLHAAARKNNQRVVEILLAADANIDAKGGKYDLTAEEESSGLGIREISNFLRDFRTKPSPEHPKKIKLE